jgi:hypothetical protein
MKCIMCNMDMEEDDFFVMQKMLGFPLSPPTTFECDCGTIYCEANQLVIRSFDGVPIETDKPVWIIQRKVYSLEEALRIKELKAFL